MSRWLDGIEEAAFKPGSGGYIFAIPHPLLFGRSRRYLVDASQKAILGAYVRKRSQLVLLAALMTVLIGAPLLMLLLKSGALLHVPPYLAGLAAGLLFVLPIVIVPHIYLMRKVGPIINGIPLTDQRFTTGEQLSQAASAMPKWMIYGGLAGGVLMMLGALAGMYDLVGEGRPTGRWISEIVVLVAGMLFAGFFIYLANLKKKKAGAS
jgi:hypothetical protein